MEITTAITAKGVTGDPAHPLKRIAAVLIDLVIVRLTLIAIYWLLHVIYGLIPNLILTDNHSESDLLIALLRSAFVPWPIMPNLIFIVIADLLYFVLGLSMAGRTGAMSWFNLRMVTVIHLEYPSMRIATAAVFQVFRLHIPPLLIAWTRQDYSVPSELAMGVAVIDDGSLKPVV